MKRQPVKWDKMFANQVLDKGWYPKCIKNSYNSITNQTKQKSNYKMGEELNRHFSKEGVQMANSTWKDAQHHSSSGKCRSKPQWGISSHLLGWPSSRRQEIAGVGEGVEKTGPLVSHNYMEFLNVKAGKNLKGHWVQAAMLHRAEDWGSHGLQYLLKFPLLM